MDGLVYRFKRCECNYQNFTWCFQKYESVCIHEMTLFNFEQIFGEKGDTGVLQLKTSDSSTNKFERGRQDKFPLQAADIGKVSHHIISLNFVLSL